MTLEFADKSNIYIRSGNLYVIPRLADNAAASPTDFSAITTPLATFDTNTGITIKKELEKQIFEGMDEDIALASKVKYIIDGVVGEIMNELIAMMTGQNPDTAGVLDTTTETGYEIVDLWSPAEIAEFAIKIEGLDPNGKEVGYIFHNCTFDATELPPFKGKEKPAWAITITADMNAGGSPGYSYLKVA